MTQETLDWMNSLSEADSKAVMPVLESLRNCISAITAKSEERVSDASAPLDQSEPLSTRLERALTLESIGDLKTELACCITLLRAQEQTAALSSHGQQNDEDGPPKDPTTGLPGRPAFERAVLNALANGQDGIIAVFVVERLAYVNKRFGRAAGDEILSFFAAHLAQELPVSQSLSRWSGPAFAVMLNSHGARKTEIELRSIARKQLSKTIESAGRSIMLPISSCCMVEILTPESSAPALFLKLDEFVAVHTPD